MSGKKFSLVVLVLLAVCAAISTGVVAAKDSDGPTGYQMVKDSSGSLKLRITTDAPVSGMWLGVTLYPPGVKVGSNQVLALKRGVNSSDITIAPTLVNGTFEAALWTKKQSKEECDPGDVACRKNGGKLIGMVSYLWGFLTY
jgi:hypothetical protein